MNDAHIKTTTKHLEKQNTGELSPGSTGRRYEPKEGVAALNKRIHQESAYLDKHKKLPFSFSKPFKNKKNVIKLCKNCKEYVSVHKNTIGIICRYCKTYSQVEEVNIEKE